MRDANGFSTCSLRPSLPSLSQMAAPWPAVTTCATVFEYFSSQEKDKHKFLADVDLLRAIVPTYPPSESHLDRSGSLDGEATLSA